MDKEKAVGCVVDCLMSIICYINESENLKEVCFDTDKKYYDSVGQEITSKQAFKKGWASYNFSLTVYKVK